MNRRLRLIGALLALFAFSAYFAESVWAASCPPDMRSHGSAAAQHGGHAGHGAAPQSSDATAPHGHHHAAADAEAESSGGEDGAPSSSCPFAAGANCVSASLGARVVSPHVVSNEVAVKILATQQVPQTLDPHTPFQPPRA